MEDTIEQNIEWKVGQEVWDIRCGKGVVETLQASVAYPIGVLFPGGGVASYTKQGKIGRMDTYRSLFFSEPVVIAERFPQKKPFAPTLQKGDTVVAKRKHGKNTVVFYVKEELEGSVVSTDSNYSKELWNFYKLGEEIKFN